MTEANLRTGKVDLLPQTASLSNHSLSGFTPGRPLWRAAGRAGWGPDGSRIRFLIVLATTLLIVCGISGWIGWATTTIEPINCPRVVLLSTDYHDNYLIPSGLYGDRAVGRFAALCDENQTNTDLNLQLFSAPIDFLDLQSIDAAFEVSGTRPLILYISAHGVSTPAGPTLLPRNATSFEEGIRLTEILKRFRSLPAASPKALILDACRIATDHRWGILHNDFSYQVKSLSNEIAEIENLTVILDSDTDQKSWIDPSSGTTVFGGEFIKSVRGPTADNDNDGWLDLFD